MLTRTDMPTLHIVSYFAGKVVFMSLHKPIITLFLTPKNPYEFANSFHAKYTPISSNAGSDGQRSANLIAHPKFCGGHKKNFDIILNTNPYVFYSPLLYVFYEFGFLIWSWYKSAAFDLSEMLPDKLTHIFNLLKEKKTVI